MSATYDPALSNALDRLRYRLGDTDTTNPYLQDETYESVLALYTNDEDAAALDLARSLIAREAKRPDRKRVGNTEYSYKDRLKGWQEIVRSLSWGTSQSTGMLFPERRDSEECEYRATVDRAW